MSSCRSTHYSYPPTRTAERLARAGRGLASHEQASRPQRNNHPQISRAPPLLRPNLQSATAAYAARCSANANFPLSLGLPIPSVRAGVRPTAAVEERGGGGDEGRREVGHLRAAAGGALRGGAVRGRPVPRRREGGKEEEEEAGREGRERWRGRPIAGAAAAGIGSRAGSGRTGTAPPRPPPWPWRVEDFRRRRRRGGRGPRLVVLKYW